MPRLRSRIDRSFEVCSRIVSVAEVGRRCLIREAWHRSLLTEHRSTRTGSSAHGARRPPQAVRQASCIAKRRREPARDGKVTRRQKVSLANGLRKRSPEHGTHHLPDEGTSDRGCGRPFTRRCSQAISAHVDGAGPRGSEGRAAMGATGVSEVRRVRPGAGTTTPSSELTGPPKRVAAT